MNKSQRVIQRAIFIVLLAAAFAFGAAQPTVAQRDQTNQAVRLARPILSRPGTIALIKSLAVN